MTQNDGNTQSPPLAAVIQAASQVVSNANGTSPRHTRSRDGGCRDDCIPCGLDALAAALAAYGAGSHQIGVAHRTLAEWDTADRSGWEAADYAGRCAELAETVRTLLGEDLAAVMGDSDTQPDPYVDAIAAEHVQEFEPG